MGNVTTVGIDLAKNVFSLHGVDANGAVVLRKTVSRARLMELVAQQPVCLIGLECIAPISPDTRVSDTSRVDGGRTEMGKKSELSAEQRVQLVLQLLSKEEPAVQIARRAGISEQTLYRWRDEFISGGKQALNGRGENELAKKISRLEEQLAERDQVIGEITIANRILKKLSGGLS